MPESRKAITPEQLYAVLDSCAGNKTHMGKALGVHRDTIRRLMEDYGIGDKPVVGGYVKSQAPNIMPLPAEGYVKRYLLTAAQNNTKVFDAFMRNLEAYRAWIDAKLMVSRFTYNKAAYENKFGSHPSKPGRGPTDADHQDLWYDKALEPYICDDPERHGSCRYQLAPDLQFCAEMNILPTATNPLSELGAYAGHNSAIFPHAKVAMQSPPRMPSDLPRFLYTTGCVTQMNYIQRKAGQKAEFHHVYGALIVEVNSKGDWWVRQINADSNGTFYDIPNGEVVKVHKGEITIGHRTEAMNWGDVHASEVDEEVKNLNWDDTGSNKPVIDILRPRKQFMNDLFSMRSQSHHERDKFAARYEKYIKGIDSVSDEVLSTLHLLKLAHRDFCETVVVNSNHDRHGERWLDEANYKADLPNARFFLEAQLDRVKAIEDGKASDWMFLRWALQQHMDCPKLLFLGMDESYLIGPRHHQVECGLHGDLGPNGSRGSTRNLAKLGRRNNKGHDHSATIFEGTYSAGVCQLKLSYNHGPTTWSVSHVVTFLNGKRCILSQRAGQLWA